MQSSMCKTILLRAVHTHKTPTNDRTSVDPEKLKTSLALPWPEMKLSPLDQVQHIFFPPEEVSVTQCSSLLSTSSLSCRSFNFLRKFHSALLQSIHWLSCVVFFALSQSKTWSPEKWKVAIKLDHNRCKKLWMKSTMKRSNYHDWNINYRIPPDCKD